MKSFAAEMMVIVFPREADRACRDYRVKFPDEIVHDNLPGQLWFGAEVPLFYTFFAFAIVFCLSFPTSLFIKMEKWKIAECCLESNFISVHSTFSL